jgi:DNA polymerase-3 subunit delta'
MAWNSVIGQERVKDLLRRTLERRQLAHAYLFYGLRGVGKQAMAIEFAKAVLCEKGKEEACGECANCKKAQALRHPDLSIVVPLPVGKNEKTGDDPIESLDADQVEIVRQQFALKSADLYHEIQIPKANFIKINSVRNLKRSTSFTSVEGSWKIFLIFDADAMNPEASNSLLKTLEEPSEKTLLILTSSEKDKLLPTIISRCQQVQFSPLSDDEIAAAVQERDQVPADEAMLIAKVAQGSYAAARDLLSENLAEEKNSVVNFIRTSLGWKELSRVDLIDELASSRDRNKVEHWLKVLQAWLRDALMLRHGATSGTASHGEDSEMRRFVERFPQADLEQAIETVEQSIASVHRNVYLHLLLTTLSFDLRKLLSKAKT